MFQILDNLKLRFLNIHYKPLENLMNLLTFLTFCSLFLIFLEIVIDFYFNFKSLIQYPFSNIIIYLLIFLSNFGFLIFRSFFVRKIRTLNSLIIGYFVIFLFITLLLRMSLFQKNLQKDYLVIDIFLASFYFFPLYSFLLFLMPILKYKVLLLIIQHDSNSVFGFLH